MSFNVRLPPLELSPGRSVPKFVIHFRLMDSVKSPQRLHVRIICQTLGLRPRASSSSFQSTCQKPRTPTKSYWRSKYFSKSPELQTKSRWCSLCQSNFQKPRTPTKSYWRSKYFSKTQNSKPRVTGAPFVKVISKSPELQPKAPGAPYTFSQEPRSPNQESLALHLSKYFPKAQNSNQKLLAPHILFSKAQNSKPRVAVPHCQSASKSPGL